MTHQEPPGPALLWRWLDGHGATAASLGRRMDVSRQAIHQWLCGAATPSLAHAVEIERVTGGAVLARDWVHRAA